MLWHTQHCHCCMTTRLAYADATINSVRTCAQVLDWELQRQLVPHMRGLTPLPGIYDPDFIAANQGARADNLISGPQHTHTPRPCAWSP